MNTDSRSAPHLGPVRLHLLPRFRLEANDRLKDWRRHQPAHELLDPRLAPRIPARPDLAEQNRRRNPVRRRRPQSTDYVALEVIKLLGPLRPGLRSAAASPPRK